MKKPKCDEGLPCRYSCIARNKSCDLNLTGRVKNVGLWLSKGVVKVMAMKNQRKTESENLITLLRYLLLFLIMTKSLQKVIK